MPADARVEVFSCGNWCEISYAGHQCWASAKYISMGGYRPAPPIAVRPPMPPAIYWHFGRPRWDDRHHAWHDGHRWWYDGRWHDRPHVGFYFEFGG